MLKPIGLGESFILSVFITHYQSMCIPALICTCYFMADKRALIDSGATDNFIHPNFTKIMGVNLQELEKPKCIYNIDNTANKAGSITHSLELKVTTKGSEKAMCFLVPDIGHEDILLSYPWLATFEPKFNWNNTIIEANALPIIFLSTHPNDTCTVIPSSQTEEEKLAIMKQLSKQTTIQGITTELAIKAGE